MSAEPAGPDPERTRVSGRPDEPTRSTPGPPVVDPPSEPELQLIPGARLGKRFRIVELLGSGGMGEVYRADDLQLGQTVALKLLPQHLAEDPTALARLRNEVRVARQVSHPNVCRVHDISEVEGKTFLSMEYIDGEDLASVLRRLGRPARGKSLEIARQLCAGLAAAHGVGVLHRDLKPANVMIDGRGSVRITDFGLAGFAREMGEGDSAGGTPGYMAPEQLTGGVTSARSDIYSLGLVLYELFTGTPAFRVRSVDELRRKLEPGLPTRPSHIAADIDPAVDELILRCLDPDPHVRPGSAHAVALELPGSDPLARAIEAGETPPPELVAAAGGTGRLSLAKGVVALSAVLVGMLTIAWLNERVALFTVAGPSTPGIVLEHRARELLTSLGHDAEGLQSAGGFQQYGGYLNHIRKTDSSPDRWSDLSEHRPTVYNYWYRVSPKTLFPADIDGRVRSSDPPLRWSGESLIWLDDRGRLCVLQVVPPELDDSPAVVVAADYSGLFEAAALEVGDFSPTTSTWNPPFYVEERAAWIGHYPGEPERPLRIEAGSYRGRPYYFHLLEEFDEPGRMAGIRERAGDDAIVMWTQVVVLISLMIGAVWIARRNLRRGSGDRTGAVRFALAVFLLSVVNGLLVTDHVPDVALETLVLLQNLGLSLLAACWSGAAYLAMEPYVRRLWPRVMISWSRLVTGRVRDPRIGRDMLLGAGAGVAVIVVQRMEPLVPLAFGVAPRWLFGARPTTFELGPAAIGEMLNPWFLTTPMYVLVVLTGLLLITRNPRVATIGMLAIMIVTDGYWTGAESGVVAIAAWAETILVWSLIAFVTIRIGLVALLTCCFFTQILQSWPLGLDLTVWYAPSRYLVVATLLAIALVAFRLAVGGRYGATMREALS